MIKLKRVYQEPSDDDGYRVLVDRLWPRGLTKEKAKVDLWLKEISPSNELRKWYNHDPDKWKVFKAKYRNELSSNKESFRKLKKIIKDKKTVTFVYSSKFEDINNAVALKEFVKK